MESLLDEFDDIILEAPVDFLGTGSDSRWAAKCEKAWNDRIARFRERLEKLLIQLPRKQ